MGCSAKVTGDKIPVREREILSKWNNRLQGTRVVVRDDQLIRECIKKKVLHLGCTDSPFTQEKLDRGTALHPKIESVASELVGVDIDGLALAALGSMCDKTDQICCDIESATLLEKLSGREFDVVVCADVIEHLNNPGAMLENLVKVMQPGSKLVITTINALAIKLVLRALFAREAVHPDHVAYYSFATLKHLLERSGFSMEDDVQTFLYPFKNRLLTAVQSPFYRLFPNVADGIIVSATRL
jgi:2-polyprenyl-3-methyl-5-hydroxy-6-metoxy-1,4-benzoquinol methylase